MEKLAWYEENRLIMYETLMDGVPDYTEEEFHKVSIIHDLLEAGMGVEVLQGYLQLLRRKTTNKAEQIRIIRKQRCELVCSLAACGNQERAAESGTLESLTENLADTESTGTGGGENDGETEGSFEAGPEGFSEQQSMQDSAESTENSNILMMWMQPNLPVL